MSHTKLEDGINKRIKEKKASKVFFYLSIFLDLNSKLGSYFFAFCSKSK